MNPLAIELNQLLSDTPAAELLSEMGKRLYFPKGIIAQSAEAKSLGKRANATIGTARKDGKPLMLSSVKEQLPGLSPAESVAYAPTAGVPELRELWLNKIGAKNPSIDIGKISLPVVVPGLTAGISYITDLFLDDGDVLLAGDPAWDNYNLIVETRHESILGGFKMLDEKGFNMESFKEAVDSRKKEGKIKLLLNFPQNPAGYTITKAEGEKIRDYLVSVADEGVKLLVCCDDAYFGLFYEDDINPESLFAMLYNAHKNILAIKIDGPTKEDCAWGFRTGFITFGCKDMTKEQYDALNKKLMGAIRSSVSCCATPSQYIIMKAIKDERTGAEKKEFEKILEERYKIVKEFLGTKKGHSVLTPMPFNSGYFMSLECKGIKAEDLRVKLLKDYGIGTVAIDENHLRIAFSSLETNTIKEVYEYIYKAAEELA